MNVRRNHPKEIPVTKAIAALGLSAAIVLSPLVASAETLLLAQAAPAGGATPAAPTHSMSHRSHLRQRSNLSKERARASAEHMRKMRQGQQ
jgi:hypothetical protein